MKTCYSSKSPWKLVIFVVWYFGTNCANTPIPKRVDTLKLKWIDSSCKQNGKIMGRSERFCIKNFAWGLGIIQNLFKYP